MKKLQTAKGHDTHSTQTRRFQEEKISSSHGQMNLNLDQALSIILQNHQIHHQMKAKAKAKVSIQFSTLGFYSETSTKQFVVWIVVQVVWNLCKRHKPASVVSGVYAVITRMLSFLKPAILSFNKGQFVFWHLHSGLLDEGTLWPKRLQLFSVFPQAIHTKR